MTTPEPKIEVIAHGPYEVTGDAPLRRRRMLQSERGEPLAWQTGPEEHRDAPYYLCRCGNSRDKPFCDGSHAFELFDGTESAGSGELTGDLVLAALIVGRRAKLAR